MSERVTTDLDGDGRPVARKRSRSTSDAVRLNNEAEVLELARHPGVAELLRVTRAEDGSVELVTAFAGTHSLDTCGPLPVRHAAGLLAAVAHTVADLHDLGIVHGRIEPSHVVLGTSGQPVLCGFAGGGHASTIPPASPQPPPDFCDPAAPIGTPLQTTTDVFGLGALLRTLVLDSEGDVEPIPDRRWSFARLRRPWSGYQRRALLTLADQATDDEPLRRPPARRVAAAIRDAVPAAQLAPLPQGAAAFEHTEDPLVADDPFAALRPTPDVDQTRAAGGRALTLVAGGIGLSLFFFGLSSLRGGSSAPQILEPVTVETPATRDEVVSTPPASSRVCAPVRGTDVGDVDGDGCPDSAQIDAGGLVTVGSARYEVGAPGDVIAIGDWDCDGQSTPAVLRPATGEVFIFAAWATRGTDVEAAAATNVAGGVDLTEQTDDAGCSILVVSTSDGRDIEVPT